MDTMFIVNKRRCIECIHSDVCFVIKTLERMGPPLMMADFHGEEGPHAYSPADYCQKFQDGAEVREGLRLYRAIQKEKEAS